MQEACLHSVFIMCLQTMQTYAVQVAAGLKAKMLSSGMRLTPAIANGMRSWSARLQQLVSIWAKLCRALLKSVVHAPHETQKDWCE